MLHQQLIRKLPDGTWVYKAPISADIHVPSIDIDEYGLWVRAAIEHKEVRDDGRAVPVCAEDISPREMIKDISEGKFVVLGQAMCSHAVFLQLPEPTFVSSTTSLTRNPPRCTRKEHPRMSSRTWESTCGRPSITTDVSPRVLWSWLLLIGIYHRLPRRRRQVAPQVSCQEAFDIQAVACASRIVGVQEITSAGAYK
jgi:hypothetical protein